MCKSCQYCLESCWWNCCEERYCWDDSIVFADEDNWNEKNGGIDNKGATLDIPSVTRQPSNIQNNNHLTDQMYSDTHRGVLQELPILAPNLYQVFSKSMIFKDDSKEPAKFDDDRGIEIKINKKTEQRKENIGKSVKFSDINENNKDGTDEQIEDKHITDFQIMFQDELYGEHKMFKIEEEDEDETLKTPDITKSIEPEEDIFEDVVLRRDLKNPTPIKVDVESGTPEKANESTSSTPKTEDILRKRFVLPRAKSAHYLARSDSSKSFGRSNSRQDLLRRVESMKENESENLKNVLAKLPETSVPFIKVPNLIDGSEIQRKSDSIFTIQDPTDSGRQSLISQMPDTPVIRGSKLPKFFAETPTIGEYKPETSLQSLKTSDVIMTEFDFSMPRYYGRYINQSKTPAPLHASNSMPDLNVAGQGKVNKRLIKLRGKLKPLVIKKNEGESSKTQKESQKF